MKLRPKIDRFLMERNGHWYYQRTIPNRFSHVDPRKRIRYTLRTESRETARTLRDHLAAADEEYWEALAIEALNSGGVSEATYRAQEHRYKAAQARALACGFKYRPAKFLALETESDDQVDELLQRVETVQDRVDLDGRPDKATAEALLGGADEPIRPTVTVSQAFQIYLDKIAFNEIAMKSKKQRYSWQKTKQTSVNYFIEVCGDVDMAKITRNMANSYRAWWIERMIPGDEQLKPAKPNTANRHIGNLKKLYDDYFTYIGEEDRLNPFRKMFFKDQQETKVPPFDNGWVRNKILIDGVFDELNDDLRLMVYVLIETGARLSEVCNLTTEQIVMDHDTPHIRITPNQRELKTFTSQREIPLVGVALDAMKHSPNGFERYRDKGELVSANLMKAFRKRDLFPTPDHVIYSFRHAFEDRMLEAGIDHDMRYYLMGHKNSRPAYGSNGTMEFRREQLLKIVHPYKAGIVAARSGS